MSSTELIKIEAIIVTESDPEGLVNVTISDVLYSEIKDFPQTFVICLFFGSYNL